MNSFKGILDQQDIDRVVAYLKYLKAKEDFSGTDEEFLEQHPEFSPKEADMEETVPTAVEGGDVESAPAVPAATLEAPGAAATPVTLETETPLVAPPVAAPVVEATPAAVVTPIVETIEVEAPTIAPATPIIETPVVPAVEAPAVPVPTVPTETPTP